MATTTVSELESATCVPWEKKTEKKSWAGHSPS
jgi:hypothetical protein